jgi:tetratricopeptide (TPR) repeat protein
MIDPTMAVAARASALLSLGRPQEAEQMVRDALQAEPDDAALLTVLARALLDQDRYSEAGEAATRIVAADPENVAGLSCLAAAAAGQRRNAKALAVVARAVQLAPNTADLHRQHAEILLANNRRAQSLTAARRARSLAPHSASIAAVLGRILLANGQVEQARAEIDRALSLDPEDARAHRAAGLFELQRGGTAESIKRYRESLRLNPADKAARRGLATALKSRNPVFRWLMLFELWLASLPSGGRWVVRLGPLLIIRLLAAQHGSPIATGLAVVLFSLIAMAWMTDSICNLILLSNRADRVLLTTGQRRAALAFATFAALAAVSLVGAFRTRWFIPYVAGFVIWALISGTVTTIRRRFAMGLYVATMGLALSSGVVGLAFAALGVHNASVAASAVLLLSTFVAAGAGALAR